MKFEAMFQPIQIDPMTVANRFVMSPMGNNFANTDGTGCGSNCFLSGKGMWRGCAAHFRSRTSTW